MLLMTAHGALGQTSITSIPEADENGEIHICLGSTVLFNDNTPDNSLSGETIFDWDLGMEIRQRQPVRIRQCTIH